MTTGWRPEIGGATRPLYLAIARAIAGDVANGRLTPGQRLPPQRELADAMGLALGTVTRAYAEAERRGLVHGRGRRGTLVATGTVPARSGLSSLLETTGLIDLAANHPSSSLDPDLASALRTVARRSNTASLLRYAPSSGLPRHREALATWLRDQGIPARGEAVVMTGGAQHALEVTLRVLARAGDEIACETLTYPGVKAVAEALGLKLRPVAMDHQGLLPDAFEELCRTRTLRALYTIPTVQNPTSAELPAERKEAIARIAEEHDVAIIEDEIQRPLALSPTTPFVALAPERTLLITSASKSVAGGLRVGCVLAPKAWVDVMAHGVQASLIACPALNAEILAGWIEDGTAKRTAAARRKENRARQQQARRVLGAAATLHTGPQSPYAWLELPDAWSYERLVREARERGVALAPAGLFAVTARDTPNAVRLALCGPPARQLLARGLEIVRDLLAGTPAFQAATL